MNLEYPYQLVAFLEAEPTVGEPVYYGENGWFPQIALKRRFKTAGIAEVELLDMLAGYCSNTPSFTIHTKGLAQPDQMPVKVLEVDATPVLMDFHNGIIDFLDGAMLSRYPERDGSNYLPHVTVEYNGEMVIDYEKYSNREFLIDKVFLLKDVHDENSIAHAELFLR